MGPWDNLRGSKIIWGVHVCYIGSISLVVLKQTRCENVLKSWTCKWSSMSSNFVPVSVKFFVWPFGQKHQEVLWHKHGTGWNTVLYYKTIKCMVVQYLFCWWNLQFKYTLNMTRGQSFSYQCCVREHVSGKSACCKKNLLNEYLPKIIITWLICYCSPWFYNYRAWNESENIEDLPCVSS